MAESNILEKLEGLVSRFEEISTLITDPNVIGDQKRYVKLTKEYKDLSEIMKARKEYINCLQNAEEAREMISAEDDPEMKEMAREELSTAERRIPELEEEPVIDDEFWDEDDGEDEEEEEEEEEDRDGDM